MPIRMQFVQEALKNAWVDIKETDNYLSIGVLENFLRKKTICVCLKIIKYCWHVDRL